MGQQSGKSAENRGKRVNNRDFPPVNRGKWVNNRDFLPVNRGKWVNNRDFLPINRGKRVNNRESRPKTVVNGSTIGIFRPSAAADAET